MDERDFVSKKREVWDRLSAIIEKAGGTKGLRALDRSEILELGPLYRRVSSDLAYARAHAVSSDLIMHLNSLVGKTHALLYEAETSGNAVQSVLDFYMYDFPILLQKRFGYFAAAFGLSVLGFLFAYWTVIAHPQKIELFIPGQFKESVEAWKSGKVVHEASPEFSGMLMAHNQQVGLIAFASGVAGGVPTVYLLFENGITLGALAALMTQVHHHDTFWPGILPHGVAELTAIFICGGAGLLLGVSLLLPGRLSRVDSFRIRGMEAIKLVLGTVPLFIFAGLIEGMFSHLGLQGWIRLTFAAINGTLWYLYLFLPRRRPESITAIANARNLAA